MQHYFFLSFLLGILVLVFLILRPYLGALVLATVLAVLFHPVYRKAVRLFRGYETVAALAVTVLILIIVITPLMLFGFQFFLEVRQLLNQNSPSSLAIPTVLAEQLSQYSIDVGTYRAQFLSWLVNNLGSVFTSISQFLINLFISLLALYYVLRDGQGLRRYIVSFSPMLDRYDQQIFGRLHVAVKSVIQGALVIALLQGTLAGIGLAIFGIAQPVLWGSATVIASLIPSVGTALVVFPIVAYLLFIGDTFAGIGFLLWGTLIVGLIDNVLRPKLIERGLNIHPLLILLSVLGGISFFGPIGFVLGPLVLSLLFALLDIYPVLVLNEPLSKSIVARR